MVQCVLALDAGTLSYTLRSELLCIFFKAQSVESLKMARSVLPPWKRCVTPCYQTCTAPENDGHCLWKFKFHYMNIIQPRPEQGTFLGLSNASLGKSPERSKTPRHITNSVSRSGWLGSGCLCVRVFVSPFSRLLTENCLKIAFH